MYFIQPGKSLPKYRAIYTNSILHEVDKRENITVSYLKYQREEIVA